MVNEKLTKGEQTLSLMRERGLTRPRDLRAHGIADEHLHRLCRQGLITQVGHGLYLPAEADITEFHSLALTARLMPSSVVCLLSALRFHDFTSQEPHEVWLALAHGAHQSTVNYPPLRSVRMNTATLEAGVETHEVENVSIKVFCAAKTVADCFKFRSQVGLDVALEALRSGWRERRFTMDELWKYACLCRVAGVMEPYIEAMVAI